MTTSNAALALPELMTVEEVADFLRTTVGAVYQMIARKKIPGVVKTPGVRRVLFKRDEIRRHVGL